MTTLFYMYYVAQEWVKRGWDWLKDFRDRRMEPVHYAPGRVAVVHRGADESYAEELRAMDEQLRTTGEIWLDDQAVLLHEDLNRLERTSLDAFNRAFDKILASFEYDRSINPETNPMKLAAQAEIGPWRNKITEEFRQTGHQFAEECRKEVAQ